MKKISKKDILFEKHRRAKVELSKRTFLHFFEYTCHYEHIRSQWNLSLFYLLDLVIERKVLNLMLEVSPRWGKTEAVARSFPAYVLGKTPDKKIVCASYAQTLASKSSRKARDMTKKTNYKDVFPEFALADAKKEGHNWETSDGGFYYAVGVGGSLTGEGFDIGIIDDYVKNREEAESLVVRESLWHWYTSTFLTRDEASLQVETAKIVFATRWNTDDLAGRILARNKKNKIKIVPVDFRLSKEEIASLVEKNGKNCQYTMRVPALNEAGESNFPERFSTEQIKEKRRDIGIRDFSALYMQDPIRSTGAVFKKSDFRYFALSDFEKENARVQKDDLDVGIFVDPAFSTRIGSDDVVIMALAIHKKTKEIYVLDILAGLFPPSVAIKQPINMANKWKARGYKVSFISAEDVTINRDQSLFVDALDDEMTRQGAMYILKRFTPKGKKADRIKFRLEPVFDRNSMFFRCDEVNEEWGKLEEQLLKFPATNHDDVMDTLAQGVETFDQMGNMGSGVVMGDVEEFGQIL